MPVALHRRAFFWLAGGMLVLLGVGFAGCTRAPDPWKEAKAGQKRILVTFTPLYCLTHAIAGDDAYVLCFLTTQGPHDYNFSPADAVKAKGADLLIYNGLELDDRFVQRINNRQQGVPTLNVGAALPETLLLKDEDEDDHPKQDEKPAKQDKAGHKHDHDKGDDHGHAHAHGDHDPHIWLGPPQAMAMVDAIAAKLAEIDSKNADGYKGRAAKVKGQLEELLDEGKAKFKGKKNREVLTMHESFIYFAKAYGLEVAGSIQAQPNQSPDAARLAKLEKLCREKNVRVITFEPQYDNKQPALLQTSLKERGLDVRLAEFDPLETAPVAADNVNPSPTYYFEKMRANIDQLAKALP
jgi:zinc transport system substrate-binding protein